MKSYLFRVYLAWMRLLAHFVRTNPKQITVLNGSGRSGSNGYLFFKYIKRNHPDYQIDLIEPWPSSHLPFSAWRKIGRAKFILTTHQPFKVKRSQINIQFWHGIPLKRMGIMARNTKRRDNQRNNKLWQQKADVVCSNSDLYETLMTSCMAISAPKYRRLGFPRLDFLRTSRVSQQDLLTDFFKTQDPQAKLGIYMPTFRYELKEAQIMRQIAQGNFFAFQDFDPEKLNQFLCEQHIYLLVKLHPYEMKLFPQEKSSYSNIAFLNNDYLFKHDRDLYELLPASAFLMTDFSSIYFDYLHLNKPIIFLTNFLSQYEKTRGLLMGPYFDVVPGARADNQKQLLPLLANIEHDSYQEKRQYWLRLSSQVQDSCDKVFDFISKQ